LPHALAWRLGIGSAYGIEQTTFAFNLLRLLRSHPVDILHVQDPQLALCMQRAGRMKLCSATTVFSHVTEEPPELLQKFQYLQHVAPWHQSEAAKCGADQPDWTMIPNFIDTTQFQPGDSRQLRRELSIPPDARVLLVASAIKKSHKRVDYLMDEVAQAITQRPDLSLVTVIAGGRESDTDELVRKGQQLLGDRVRFLIQFPRKRMPELYRMADLLIHGSLFEMFGTVLLEAMASGVPCIVHDHPVMNWVVGQGGMAVDLSQTGNLARLLLVLLSDPTALQRTGNVARQRVCHEFSREVVVERILEYYQRITASH
jgi:1,2-diacylglycerol 3-alpha-glucosyltransferase